MRWTFAGHPQHQGPDGLWGWTTTHGPWPSATWVGTTWNLQPVDQCGPDEAGQESRSTGDRATPSVFAMNRSLRQIHRWTSIVFTVSIIVTIIALVQKEPIVWVSYVPLFPLAVLLLTGLYMFAFPYATGWRLRRRAARQP